MAGPLTLWRDPAKPLEAATKQYVDDVSGSTRTRYEVYSSYESLPQDPQDASNIIFLVEISDQQSQDKIYNQYIYISNLYGPESGGYVSLGVTGLNFEDFVTQEQLEESIQNKITDPDTKSNGQTLIYKSTNESWEAGDFPDTGMYYDSQNSAIMQGNTNLTYTIQSLLEQDYPYTFSDTVPTSSTVGDPGQIVIVLAENVVVGNNNYGNYPQFVCIGSTTSDGATTYLWERTHIGKAFVSGHTLCVSNMSVVNNRTLVLF